LFEQNEDQNATAILFILSSETPAEEQKGYQK